MQDATSLDYKYFTEESLTTNYQRYSSTFTVDKSTSDNYRIKFKLYSTASVFLDKVQVGRKDWLTLTGIQKQYLNTPTFIPDYNTMSGAQLRKSADNTPVSGVNPDKKEENNLTIFPNPVRDILHITGTNEGAAYMIYNNRGDLMLKGKGKRINVSSLDPGMYILLIGNKIKIKFVKVE